MCYQTDPKFRKSVTKTPVLYRALAHSLTHSQALQPMQGFGRLKKPPPIISISGPGP